jgi:hypothetical protein
MIIFLIHQGRAKAEALSRGHYIPLHPELGKVVTGDTLMPSDPAFATWMMRHQCHPYRHRDAATKVATNMEPALHPPQRQIKTVQADDILLPPRCGKVLGGGKNSPSMQPFSRRSDMGLCQHDTAPSADHTRHWNETNREFNPWTS